MRSVVCKNLLSRGGRGIGGDRLLILDLSELSKKYAKKREHMCEVWDGSEGKVGGCDY